MKKSQMETFFLTLEMSSRNQAEIDKNILETDVLRESHKLYPNCFRLNAFKITSKLPTLKSPGRKTKQDAL